MLGSIFAKLKSLFAGRPAATNIHTDCSELKSFADDFKKWQNDSFGNLESSLNHRTVRISRFLYDNENDILDVFDKISTVSSAKRRESSVTKYVFGAMVVFALSAWSVYSLLKLGDKTLFMPLVASVVALAGFLIFAICAINAISGKKETEFSFKVMIPEQERKRFFEEDCAVLEEKLKEQIKSIDSIVSKPANHEEGTLDCLSEIYCGLREAEKLNAYSNVAGWIIPQCEHLLVESGLKIIDSYDGENDGLFIVQNATQADSSFVLSPAVVRSQDGFVIKRGKYIRSSR